MTSPLPHAGPVNDDPLNAFCKDSNAYLPGALTGPLSGLSFAAKDIFDVAGHVTGCGNPDWKATHQAAEKNAWVVEMLVNAGATMVGKTLTDELTRGIFGENVHYGTPTNPKARGCVPGGSSSGSASAVAGGLVDFALGSDTGGSVRVPASFCALYGMRPTHGAIPLDGMLLQAPSFDTIGWFARDLGYLFPDCGGPTRRYGRGNQAPATGYCGRRVRTGGKGGPGRASTLRGRPVIADGRRIHPKACPRRPGRLVGLPTDASRPGGLGLGARLDRAGQPPVQLRGFREIHSGQSDNR